MQEERESNYREKLLAIYLQAINVPSDPRATYLANEETKANKYVNQLLYWRRQGAVSLGHI